KLIYLYDDNHISLEGPTSWAFTESVPERFGAYGWQVLRVPDGNDLDQIDAALREARSETRRPSLICVRTHIGYGSPVQDTREAHGEALGPVNTKATKEKLGWPLDPTFLVPEEARAHFDLARERGATWQAEWAKLAERFRSSHPSDAMTLEDQLAGRFPTGWDAGMPTFLPKDGPMATRDASQKVLDALAPRLPALLGGAADLSPSTKTLLPGTPDFSATDGVGRNFHFGVREHAMSAILNGMALHGGLIPYGGTFLTFSDYARGALRLAALQQTHSIFVYTHDSVGMGEDGPTHQPVEQLLGLRSIPGFTVIRPADANETVAAWRVALARPGPTAFVFSRQKLPILDVASNIMARGVPHGGYVLSEAVGGPAEVVLIATGSEVSLVLEAQGRLAQRGIRARVVSLPSWRLFDEQPAPYRDSVLPEAVPKLSVEAGVTIGWARYVGSEGRSIGVDRFGASAPGPVVQRELGLTVEHVVDEADLLVRSRAAGGAP
ncbi:MAG: transketolase, partial [Thermoplasmata archaeon]